MLYSKYLPEYSFFIKLKKKSITLDIIKKQINCSKKNNFDLEKWTTKKFMSKDL